MSDELTWMPGWQLRDLMAKREVSCAEVVDHFLARIDEFNDTLRAFEEVDAADARAQAKRADEAVAAGDDLGPLHGIPTSVKSHIRVEGYLHSMGRTSERSRFDDLSVERLRQAGAIVFGTNRMMGAGGGGIPDRDQPGVFRPFNWEAEALNPWDTTRVPGWSSSGGAAAAAAALSRSPSARTGAGRPGCRRRIRAWWDSTPPADSSPMSTTRSRR